MENARLLNCLAADYAKLRYAAERELTAPVPSCPGWTMTDLVTHVAHVYLHKAEAMRQGRQPEPWPPDLSGEEPLPLLDRAYRELEAEFAARDPADPAWTFYDPDQTVGFWIRRMAQETAIHRVDAELALGEPLSPIPDDLALDGVDEALVRFLRFGAEGWFEYFEPELKNSTGAAVEVRPEGGRWRVAWTPTAIEVVPQASGAGGGPAGSGGDAPGTGEGAGASVAQVAPVASVSGAADPVLRWLWGRGIDGIEIDGDAEAAALLRRLMVIATQ